MEARGEREVDQAGEEQYVTDWPVGYVVRDRSRSDRTERATTSRERPVPTNASKFVTGVAMPSVRSGPPCALRV